MELEPDYALAHTGIAVVWGVRGHMGYVRPREAFPKWKAAALRALEIDDTLAEARAAAGGARMYVDWDWAEAEREFQRAIELNPTTQNVRIWYWELLDLAGRWDEGMEQMELLLELDPLNSLSKTFLGQSLVFRRRYDDAIAQLRNVLETEPNNPLAPSLLWTAFHQERMYEEALAEAKKTLRGYKEIVEALDRSDAQVDYPAAMRLAAEILEARSKQPTFKPI